ncbi:uncharacterized protein [Amphiura filiformis]|uniref:uncharacterized protein n=1 Tax=Amphiura filiformis TaxID=82378 RepID=UPI003B211515
MNLGVVGEVAMASETGGSITMVENSDQKTRKQTRFSIASSPGPLGTITNLVLPGAGSPVKNENEQNTAPPGHPDDSTMADKGMETGSSDENEIFFGPMTDYEKRKATKLRRRTVAYTPNFRANLRTPSKASADERRSSDEIESSTEQEDVTETENPADFTSDSVFIDTSEQSENKTSSHSNSNRHFTSSAFYSASEFPVEEDGFQKESNVTVDCADVSVYHQALSVSDYVPGEGELSRRQLSTISDNEATPIASVSECFEDRPNTTQKVSVLSNDTTTVRAFTKAFKDMSSLKEKSAKFLEELRMEQRSRGNTPTNSPVPKKIAKKSDQPIPLQFQESSSSSETSSSQEDLTDIDRQGIKSSPSTDLGESSVVGILQETANRLQLKPHDTPTKAGFGDVNSSHQCGTPNSNLGMSMYDRCNSPMVFSSPKVFPVTVQAQSMRNPMCSVAYSPHTPNQLSKASSAFSSPLVPHKPSPIVAVPRAFRPVNDNVTMTGLSASASTSAGSAFNPVGNVFSVQERGSPAPNSAFMSISLSDSPFQKMPSANNETPNKEKMLDSPNITLRSRKRNAGKSTPVAVPVQAVHPLPVQSQAEGMQTLSSGVFSPRLHGMMRQQQTMSPRPMMVATQEHSSSPHQQLAQMSKWSLLEQKQQELARIRAEKQMLKQKIKEDNVKCFQMRTEIVAALRSNTSPEGLPPMDSHIVIFRPEGTSALTLNDQELDVVTRLHTIKNSHATARDQTYDSPVAHDKHRTGRVRLQWHDELVTPVDQLSSPRLYRLHAPVMAHSILLKK